MSTHYGTRPLTVYYRTFGKPDPGHSTDLRGEDVRTRGSRTRPLGGRTSGRRSRSPRCWFHSHRASGLGARRTSRSCREAPESRLRPFVAGALGGLRVFCESHPRRRVLRSSPGDHQVSPLENRSGGWGDPVPPAYYGKTEIPER